MLKFFRRSTKSVAGTIVAALFLIAIIASFAMSDLSNVGSGSIGGLDSSTLAKVGNERITDRDLSEAMQRRLQEVREQNPEADYSTIARDFGRVLAALIDQKALFAFASEYGFHLSKRLVDAEIAQIPGTKGLNGQFSEQAYAAFLQQQRMTDAQVREIISTSLLQRLLLVPVVSDARVPVGVATPYASMLLEAREGEVAGIPAAVFRAGLNPTDSDLQRFHAANRARYMVPEQRVLRIAKIGPEQVANVAPSEAEIAAFYKANQATYGAKELRDLSQAVVADRSAANALAARAKAGGSFAAAAAPAGLSAQDVALGPQTRQQYASVAGANVANAVFSAAQGAVVGPIQSDLGWIVVKVNSVTRQGGKTLDQARPEIRDRLTADKRTQALEDLVSRVQTALDEGSNFQEAAALGKLAVTATPLITANGRSRTDAAYRFPAELGPALRAGFEIAANEQPEIVTLQGNQGYAVVAPGEVVAAAPAPLASIRQQVANDWIAQQSAARARAVADAIGTKAARNVPLAQAVREAGVPLPPVRPLAARRMELGELEQNVPPALRMLFTLGQGKSRLVGDPQGRGFFVVKVNRIVPGNALLQPALIGRMQNEFREPTGQEYAQQFLAAMRDDLKVERNEKAIAAARQRIAGN